MKLAIKYGCYIGIVITLITLFYYFVSPISMYSKFGKTTILELFIYSFFMFLAISKNSNSIDDGGTFFKIAFLTLAVGLIISFVFKYSFSHLLSEELNPIFLEAKKLDERNAGDFFGQDPLYTLETVELMENTIEEDMTVLKFLAQSGIGLLFLGIPFTILVTFLSRKILNFKKKRLKNQNQNQNLQNL